MIIEFRRKKYPFNPTDARWNYKIRYSPGIYIISTEDGKKSIELNESEFEELKGMFAKILGTKNKTKGGICRRETFITGENVCDE